MEKKYVQILQIPPKTFTDLSFVAVVDCHKVDHVTRRVIQFWEFHIEDGFGLVY